tara:strand:- start:38738 stop:39877 length:1140 start_codon:yes stop_codon:yes gene_type:complete
LSKIRIGFVVNNLVVGGVSAVLINLCNQLNQNKYEVHLLVLSDYLEMEKIIPLSTHVNKYIFSYAFLESYSLSSYLKSAFSQKVTNSRSVKVTAKIKELNLDILHFHTLPRQLVIGQLAQKENPRLKLVFTDHLLRISEGQYKKHQRILLTIALKRYYRSYHLIAVSKSVYNFIRQNYLNNKEFELLENSISINDFNRTYPITSDAPNKFIYVSRMNHHKGQNTLIEAWKKINDVNKGKLILIGPDESNGKFYEMAKEDSSIEFTGSVPNVKDYLNNSTVAIFPSQKEGLPIALLEMMAYELPIICSNIPELTSIISDNKQGLHFMLDDVDDLASKIIFAINNKDKMISMGKNARSKVEDICCRNEPIAFHDSFYRTIL